MRAKLFLKDSKQDMSHMFWSFLGAVLGISLIGLIQEFTDFTKADGVFLIGSFGASSVLIYGAIDSPLSKPRNLIFGHLLSAIIGVGIAKLLPDQLWLAASLSVAFSIVAMQLTDTVHPPGGATALIAVIGSEKIKSMGFFYVLSPILSGVLILYFVALVVNNIPKGRSYPYKKS